MKSALGIISVLFTLITSVGLASETINIPKEELARESVLPKFDRPDNVRNRNVVTAEKIEAGVYYGGNFTEPIYNQKKAGLNLAYHWNETSAIAINFAKWAGGLNSQYVPQIESTPSPHLDFSRIPDIQYSFWANYEVNAYYGKISLTKQGVMNLSLYPIMGIGATKYENKTYPGVNLGVGQKFYFTNALALRIDFKIQYQQSPNPFLPHSELEVGSTKPSFGNFTDKWDFGTVLDVGFSYLF